MDIDEYLKKKKELEQKKEILEGKNLVDKKKTEPEKKKVEIKRKREITKVESQAPPPGGQGGQPHYSHPKDNIHWVFLGLAFFVALIIVGIYFLSTVGRGPVEIDEKSDEVKELEEKLEELQKTLNDSEEEEEESEEIEEENETSEEGVSAIGPDFDIYLLDEHTDSISLGTFDDEGKVGGNLIQIWAGSGGIGTYQYRMGIKNEELAVIQCKVDKTTETDSDQDGTIDDTDYHLDRYVLEMDVGDEEEYTDSVVSTGKITITYEARCYFCEDNNCDSVYYEGESKDSAKLEVIIHPTAFNATNST